MKKYRIQKVLETTELVLDAIYCDKCKAIIPDTDALDLFSHNWFSYSTGVHYPEGNGNIVNKSLDLCQTCSDVLITILEQNGFTPTVETINY